MAARFTWMWSTTRWSTSRPLKSAFASAFRSSCSRCSHDFFGQRPWVVPNALACRTERQRYVSVGTGEVGRRVGHCPCPALVRPRDSAVPGTPISGLPRESSLVVFIDTQITANSSSRVRLSTLPSTQAIEAGISHSAEGAQRALGDAAGQSCTSSHCTTNTRVPRTDQRHCHSIPVLAGAGSCGPLPLPGSKGKLNGCRFEIIKQTQCSSRVLKIQAHFFKTGLPIVSQN